MLIQNSLPCSIEAALSFIDHQKQDLLFDWIPRPENCQKCPNCNKHSQGGCCCSVPALEGGKDSKNSCSLDFLSCSQLSTVGTMLEKCTNTFVYQRRKLQRKSLTVSPEQASVNTKPSDGCVSAISSEVPSVATKEHLVSPVEDETKTVRSPVFFPLGCDRETLFSNSESFNACSAGEDPGSGEALRSDIQKVLDFCCINDSCSSSKSNMDLGSAFLKTKEDDIDDCSSSGALVIGGLRDDMSVKEICISILVSQGLLERVWPMRTCDSAEGSSVLDDCCSSRSCKVCDLSGTTLKMLICDNCEEAFHLSCCNLRMKKIPVDDWFCQSCSKKKSKILKEKTNESTSISSEIGRYRNMTSKVDLGPIELMLKDNEKYRTSVRIGTEFQAEVPEWSGPVVGEFDPVNEPLEINPLVCGSMHDGFFKKPSILSSIGNWLQCQQFTEGVGEGVDGTICGKWRRAPLFEVQTENWECFHAVLWDPAHADCAVPQELDTNEVWKQLRHIEMLRPRLAVRKRKLGCSNGFTSRDSLQDLTEDA